MGLLSEASPMLSTRVVGVRMGLCLWLQSTCSNLIFALMAESCCQGVAVLGSHLRICSGVNGPVWRILAAWPEVVRTSVEGEVMESCCSIMVDGLRGYRKPPALLG